MQRFTLDGPLPTGTTVLEASAGTGKTWTIAALATRFIAEGHVTIDQVMMVTFTNLATAELRSRVYERLQSSLSALQTFQITKVAPTHPADRMLIDCSPAELDARIERLDQALGNIDAAVITTTHEFCARMLSELGLLVDHDDTARFVDDPSDLIEQAVNDEYVRTAGRAGSLKELLAVGQAAVNHARTPIVGTTSEPSPRVAFAHAIRSSVARRKRQLGVFGFDDMITRLVDALCDATSGEQACRVLSSRFPLVMVDEFQDTDPDQWLILREAFHNYSTLVLIGDPKQAIYSFRGADINSYQDAFSVSDQQQTLSINYRSDAPVVAGIKQLFREASLGVDGPPIVVHPIEAHVEHARIWLGDGAPRQRVHVRLIDQPGTHRVDAVRPTVDADVVATVDELLHGPARIQRADGTDTRVRANDIAIIVRTNARARLLLDALHVAGIPAVFSGASSVFMSQAADDWQAVLDAIADPRAATVALASLTSLFGWTSDRLARAPISDTVALHGQVKNLRRTYDEVGVAGVFESLLVGNNVYPRLLSTSDGDRLITDLRHVAQELNAHQRRTRVGVAGLAAWLRDQRADETAAQRGDTRTRRLETDLPAVQLITIHGAKGLQYPIVLLPQASDTRFSRDEGEPIVVHWEGERVLDVDPRGAGRPDRAKRWQAEQAAESLREFYVGATRAQSLLIAWWAPFKSNTPPSPLHRLLMNEQPPSEPPALRYELPEDEPHDLPDVGPDVLIERVTTPREVSAKTEPADALTLEARAFTRFIDHEWKRTSYSGLTRAAHDGAYTPVNLFDEVDEPLLDEIDAELADAVAEPASTPTDVSPMAEFAGGTQFGTVVHAIFEAVDPRSANLESDLVELSRRSLDRWPVADLAPEALGAALASVMDAPLGSLADGATLSGFSVADRLAELDFEMPLGDAGGQGRATVAALAALWRDTSLVPADDPLVAYGDHLAASPAADEALAGFLTGSIDAVFRVGAAPTERYVVVDYKTNRVPTALNAPLRVSDYSEAAMTRAMIESHYPLQALLYCVALHRYLSWRLPGYDPAQHLGGVGYLFVRGMSAEHGPADGSAMPFGVFTWRPTAALVQAASTILAGGSHEA